MTDPTPSAESVDRLILERDAALARVAALEAAIGPVEHLDAYVECLEIDGDYPAISRLLFIIAAAAESDSNGGTT